MITNRKTALFIDDDESFLELARRAVTHYTGARWDVLTAPNASGGLALLDQQPVNAILIDIHMPVMDGVQLLSVLQNRHPLLPKIMLTGDGSESSRSGSLRNGAELFLTKPETREGWREVIAAMEHLADAQAGDGFRGVLRKVGLQDILQLTCLARHSVVLRVRSQFAEGLVYVEDGRIIHAQCGDLTGEEGFNAIMALPRGEFDLQPFAPPPVQSIYQQWEFLVMEAARKRDEIGEAPATSAPVSKGHTPAHTPVARGKEVAIGVPNARSPSAASAADRVNRALQPRVDELLVFSPDGQVLHEWQSGAPSARMELIAFLRELTPRIAEALPVGPFDRLEIEADRSRVIAILKPERALLVRTSRIPVEAASR